MCRNLLQPFWVDCVLFNGDDRYQLCLWRNFVFPFFNAFFIINSIFSWRRYAESSTTEYYLIVFSFLKMFKNFFLKKLYDPYLWMGLTTSRLQSHNEETVYFLKLSPWKFLVLISSTSEWWKAESTLEPPCGFKHGNPGFGIQCLLN